MVRRQMMQMGLQSHGGAPTQPHQPTLQQQQQQMQQIYNPFFAQQQQAGPHMQQMLNSAGSGVSASAGGPGAPQQNTLAMAQQQQQLNGANQLNFVPPATRPAQASNMFSQAQRGFYPPAMAAQVRSFVLYAMTPLVGDVTFYMLSN